MNLNWLLCGGIGEYLLKDLDVFFKNDTFRVLPSFAGARCNAHAHAKAKQNRDRSCRALEEEVPDSNFKAYYRPWIRDSNFKPGRFQDSKLINQFLGKYSSCGVVT